MPKQTDLTSFRIIESIQESKRFIIHKAEALTSGDRVAIKTTVPMVSADEALRQSLRNEALVTQQLNHSHIRKGISCFEDAGQVFMIAEYVDGISLGRYMLNYPGGISPELGVLWALNIADALAYAQRLGIQHQNLNPYNIIIDQTNQLKIIGFGKERKAWKHSEGNFKFAFPVLYTAVEEFRGSLIRDNSDLYSWAVITYQMLSGTLPWRVDSFISPEEQKEQCLTRAIQQPDSHKIPDWLYSIILDCLKLDPNDRPKTPAILAEALRAEGNYADYTELEEAAEQSAFHAELIREIEQPKEVEEINPELQEADEVEPSLEQPSDDDLPIILPEEAEIETSAMEEVTEPAEILSEEPDIESLPSEDTLEPDLYSSEGPEESETEDLQEDNILLASDEYLSTEDQEPTQIELPLETEDEQPWDKIKQILEDEPTREAESEEQAIQADLEPESLFDAELPEAHPEAPVDQPPIPEPPASLPPNQEQTVVAPVTPVHKPIKITASTSMDHTHKEDLSGMQKTFRIMMIVSVLIILFLFARYLLTRDTPELSNQAESETVEESPVQALLKENKAIEMIRVKADSLVMGNISPLAEDDEFPLLTIGLSSYLISATEVTQEQWMMVFAQNPSQFKGDQLPVENVSFYDVIDFCNAKSLKDGLNPAYDVYGSEIVCDFEANGYRLPTEAEWELAAKSGMGKGFDLYSGSELADDVAWFSANSGGKSRKVGSKQANQLGLFDMSGNVAEWVWNWYAPYTYRIPNLNTGPLSGTDKVIRGGSWHQGSNELRTTNRDYQKPFAKNGYTGFRVVRSN